MREGTYTEIRGSPNIVIHYVTSPLQDTKIIVYMDS
jgi:hypothetical protein